MSMNHFSYIYWPPVLPSMSSLTESSWTLFSTRSSSEHLASNHLALLLFSSSSPVPLLSRHRPMLLSLKATSYTYRCPLEATRYTTFFPHGTTNLYWSWSAFWSKVVENPRYAAPISSGRIFESIEELLSALSRRYEQRKREALFSQLERLSWQSKLRTVSPWCSQKII